MRSGGVAPLNPWSWLNWCAWGVSAGLFLLMLVDLLKTERAGLKKKRDQQKQA
jgi:hypothetical protein